jgi:asparagine synthetase B (glutamine-hydrolysing)
MINPEYLVSDFQILMDVIENEIKVLPKEDVIFYFTQRIHTPGLIKRGKNAIEFNGMNNSFPYMSPNLVQYVNSLPLEYKIFGSTAKYILRQLALEYMGGEFAYAPKNPFPVPFDTWMANVDEWPLSEKVFASSNIAGLKAWTKWMLINLDVWVKQCLQS